MSIQILLLGRNENKRESRSDLDHLQGCIKLVLFCVNFGYAESHLVFLNIGLQQCAANINFLLNFILPNKLLTLPFNSSFSLSS